MDALKKIINPISIERLASRSYLRYGKEIAKHGEIQILDQNTFNIVGKIKDGHKETRTAELRSTTKGLRWKCTCSNRKDLFCQHCVALALKLNEDLSAVE